MTLARIDTPVLSIACHISGPADSRPLFLLHGWPDEAGTWKPLLPFLDGFAEE